jgi:hypothetical protein
MRSFFTIEPREVDDDAITARSLEVFAQEILRFQNAPAAGGYGQHFAL